MLIYNMIVPMILAIQSHLVAGMILTLLFLTYFYSYCYYLYVLLQNERVKIFVPFLTLVRQLHVGEYLHHTKTKHSKPSEYMY